MSEWYETERIPLAVCEAGAEVEIAEIEAETRLAARLRELGMVPGVPLRVARQGAPLIIQLGPARICLRASEASHILVRPAPWAAIEEPLTAVSCEETLA